MIATELIIVMSQLEPEIMQLQQESHPQAFVAFVAFFFVVRVLLASQ